jgi:ATP-dependent DNA ligase
VNVPIDPSLPPMLARLARELPRGGYLYEPKWDGFRALVFRDGDDVDIRSRHQRPLGRYFPELVAALAARPTQRFVLDGEIVIIRPQGFDFEALLSRLHPAATRVAQLREETPASFIAFDALVVDGVDLRDDPFHARRAALERIMTDARSPLHVTPITDDVDVARNWLERFEGGGIDGVVAKHRELRYSAGERAMIKVKHERTADCVVAGFRIYAGEPLVASLLLGLYDGPVLHHVGVVSSFKEQQRRELFDELRRIVIPLADHPWKDGFVINASAVGRLRGAAGRWTPDTPADWIAIRPERVVEVGYDHLEARRFRHPARFRRWRPDRDPRSCTLDQLAMSGADAAEVLR